MGGAEFGGSRFSEGAYLVMADVFWGGPFFCLFRGYQVLPGKDSSPKRKTAHRLSIWTYPGMASGSWSRLSCLFLKIEGLNDLTPLEGAQNMLVRR